MNELLLGIDIGTTATKAILCTPSGRIIAEAEAPATLRSPYPGWAEEDPEEWWANAGRVVKVCLDTAGRKAGDIAAVGVSGMVPALIVVGRDGRALRPSIQQNDARAYAEIEYFRQRTDEEVVLHKTGSAITQQSIGPKLLWLRRHEPQVMEAGWKVMGSYDYIVYRLTGDVSVERNWALENGLFDLHRQDWDDQLLQLATIDRGWLGTVHWPSEVVGRVSREAAAATGLLQGTPVVAGSADHIASAFAAGLHQEGDLLVKLGGAGDILYSLDRAVVDRRLFLDYHVVQGKFMINGCMAASGSILKWFLQEFAPSADFSSLDAEASRIPPGSEGLVLLPYFLGEKTPIFDPLARGVLFGLTLTHTRAHVYRACLEGVAYGFYHHLEVLMNRGLRVRRARVTNGGAHSQLWRQITADVLGIALEGLAHHPASSLGAAVVAGMGVGLFTDWSQIDRFIAIGSVMQPDAERHERYLKAYAIYRDLYESLKPLFPRLRAFGGEAG